MRGHYWARPRRSVPWLLILAILFGMAISIWFMASPMSVLRHRFWPGWLDGFENFAN